MVNTILFDIEKDKKDVKEYQSVDSEEFIQEKHPEYDSGTIIDERIKQGGK